jgi:hypothetical protein
MSVSAQLSSRRSTAVPSPSRSPSARWPPAVVPFQACAFCLAVSAARAEGRGRNLVHETASAFPVFRDQVEAVIRLKARTHWIMEPPSFI